jgi:phosphoribosyl-AMP cyclohydrolase
LAFLGRKKYSKDENKAPDEFIIDDQLKVIFNSNGLIPVIIQNEKTGEVIRIGYLDKWALEMSLNDKKVYLFRRSLQRVEKWGEKDQVEYDISSIKLGRYHRSLLFGIKTPKSKKIPTNFIHSVYQENNKK